MRLVSARRGTSGGWKAAEQQWKVDDDERERDAAQLRHDLSGDPTMTNLQRAMAPLPAAADNNIDRASPFPVFVSPRIDGIPLHLKSAIGMMRITQGYSR